jgi:hypothetical protein
VGDTVQKSAAQRRGERLAEELRANLAKRKAQARSRKTGETDLSGEPQDQAERPSEPDEQH